MPLSNCEFTENRCSENHTILTSAKNSATFSKCIEFGQNSVHHTHTKMYWVTTIFVENQHSESRTLLEGVNQFPSFSTLTIRPELKFCTGELNVTLLGICQFLNIGAGSGRTFLMRVTKFTSTCKWHFESKGCPEARVLRHGEQDLQSC